MSTSQNPPPDESAGTRDVEKRWNDPKAFRRVAAYCLAVVAVDIIVGLVIATTGGSQVVFAVTVTAILLAGGLGALAIGLAEYRRGRNWVHWQGGAWFLLALFLGTLFLVPAAVY